MLKIGLMSDTHSCLDPQLFDLFAPCDEIWHAGDFGNMAVVEQLRGFRPLRGVYGNIDGADIRAQFAENEVFTCEGLKVCMTHIGGSATRYPARVRLLLQAHSPHVFICGHSHLLLIQPQVGFNCLHINSGACGNEGWHKEKTALRFDIADGKIKNMELLKLGLRGSHQAHEI